MSSYLAYPYGHIIKARLALLGLVLAILLTGCDHKQGQGTPEPADNWAPEPVLMTPAQPTAEAVAMRPRLLTLLPRPNLQQLKSAQIATAVAATLTSQPTATATARRTLAPVARATPTLTIRPASPSGFPAIVISKGLNLRRGPGVDYSNYCRLRPGDYCPGAGPIRGWSLVVCPDA